MTTKLIIKNDACSNGDVNLHIKCGERVEADLTITPGGSHEAWVSTEHKIDIDETWPTIQPATEQQKAGALADSLIAKEVAVQDLMWGEANERADSTENQLIAAAQAQLQLTSCLLDGHDAARATALALLDYYPEDWDGLRSYGSVVANLGVVAAFCRSEMKRRILLGEDITRTKRGEPYTTAQPNLSSDEALAQLQ
jgi:hypothetical protein